MRIDSSEARTFAAEFPDALKFRPLNSNGDGEFSDTVYEETLGRISIISEFEIPFTVCISLL